jgi:hypothetical protein
MIYVVYIYICVYTEMFILYTRTHTIDVLVIMFSLLLLWFFSYLFVIFLFFLFSLFFSFFFFFFFFFLMNFASFGTQALIF